MQRIADNSDELIGIFKKVAQECEVTTRLLRVTNERIGDLS